MRRIKILEAVFITLLCFTSSLTQAEEATEDTREPKSVGPFTTVEAITSEEAAAALTTMDEPSTSIADSNSEATTDSESTTVVGFLTTVVGTTEGAAGVTMFDERSTPVLDSGRTIGETNVADSEREVTVATTVVIAGYSGFIHTMSVEETSVAGADSTSVTMRVVASTYVDDTTTSVTESEIITATLEVTDSMALGVSSGEDYMYVTSVEATTGGIYADTTAAIEIADTTEASYAVGVEYTYVGGPTTSVTDSVDVVRGTVTDTTSVEETTIAVPMPPSIERGPLESVIYRNGENVTLHCTAKGGPSVTYEWKKNGLILNQTHQNIDNGVDGTMTIRNAAASDEGFYQCLARNQYGTAISKMAHLQRAFIDSAKRNSTDVLNKTVQEGMPFHIPCDAPSSFPKPAYDWELANDTEEENSIPLQPSKRIQIDENGDLHFAYALPEDDLDGRIYRCTTNNTFLDVEVKGGYTQLTVTRKPTESIREFAPTLAFTSMETPRGRVTFRCFFYGYPEPIIIWSTPNGTLPFGRYTLDPFNTSLRIDNVMYSDEGSYTCTASNTTQTFWLIVGSAPVFPTVKDGPHDEVATEGESVTFRCNTTAKPAAKIVWFQDGKELDSDKPPNRYVFSTDNTSLTIRNVCRDCVDRESKTDQTIIQCNASNIFGYVFAQGYLHVYQKHCFGERDREHHILWTSAPVGTEIFLPCPGNRSGRHIYVHTTRYSVSN